VVEPAVKVQPQIPTADPSPTSPKLPAKASIEIQVPVSTSATDKLPPASISERKQSLKLKAINTLTNYLQNGDAVTHTEVLKNGQGQVMNRKVTTTRRGCPSWTIEEIKKLEEELSKI
jgi:hypothetical protein